MGLVVDTSAFVDLERSDHGFDAALEDEPTVIPAIVLAELLVGVELAKTPAIAARRRARIEVLTARVPVVEFGSALAELWATLFADLRLQGTPIPANDLAVAATARSLGFAVLVGERDEAHFRRVDGLDVRVVRRPGRP